MSAEMLVEYQPRCRSSVSLDVEYQLRCRSSFGPGIG